MRKFTQINTSDEPTSYNETNTTDINNDAALRSVVDAVSGDETVDMASKAARTT